MTTITTRNSLIACLQKIVGIFDKKQETVLAVPPYYFFTLHASLKEHFVPGVAEQWSLLYYLTFALSLIVKIFP